MTLRDLFLVALEIKKKEIEDAFEKDGENECVAGKESGEPENNKSEKETAVPAAKPVNVCFSLFSLIVSLSVCCHGDAMCY